jgi:GMP synthase-like glutamine amidotransferase
MLLVVNNSKSNNKISYINKLRKALSSLNIPFHEVKSFDDDIEKIKHKIKGIILSGSPIKLSIENKFEDYAININSLLKINDVPVLGICFGAQLLHVLNGGILVDQKKYFCEATDVELSKHKLFSNITDSQMQFCFSDVPIKNTKIKEIAWFHFNGKRIPCAFEFKKNIFSCLFHPEALQSSHQIIKNFAKLCWT